MIGGDVWWGVVRHARLDDGHQAGRRAIVIGDAAQNDAAQIARLIAAKIFRQAAEVRNAAGQETLLAVVKTLKA